LGLLRPDPKPADHSDRGVQYLSVRYSERLADNDIVASVGSRGDSYDNALVEAFNSLYKWELIYRQGPWKGLDDVEFATRRALGVAAPARFTEALGQPGSEAWVVLAYQVQDECVDLGQRRAHLGSTAEAVHAHEPEVRTEHSLLRAAHATAEARQVLQSLGDHVIEFHGENLLSPLTVTTA
jgi:transposase InsO family protein